MVEAMSLGVPVVITDQVGIHCEVAQARAGFVTKAADEPLAAAVVKVLSDPSRAALGHNGVALSRSHFDAASVTQRLLDTYMTVLDRGNKVPAGFVI